MTHQANPELLNTVLQLLTEEGSGGFAESIRLLVNEAMLQERAQALRAQPYEPKNRSYSSTWWWRCGLSEPFKGILDCLAGEQAQEVALGFQLRRSCGQPRLQPLVAAL